MCVKEPHTSGTCIKDPSYQTKSLYNIFVKSFLNRTVSYEGANGIVWTDDPNFSALLGGSGDAKF